MNAYFFIEKIRKDVTQIQRKNEERSPPLKTNTIFLFCLIDIYLNEWILSRVRSTKLALDKIQLFRYFLCGRIEKSQK